MSNKVHSQRNIPFSWEKKPGVSKAVDLQDAPQKLPPPPCPSENNGRVAFHHIQIPLPPCTFQQMGRSSSRKGSKMKDDPFLIAYNEVTKSRNNTKAKFLVSNDKSGERGFGFKKNMSIFSCKQSSCSVMEDSIVRLSQVPISRSQREGGHN